MAFSVRILGCSSATPTASRHPSAQLLNVNERLFLIDCGEGTQMQLRRYKIRHSRIHHIFISHLHGDHYLGLAGLIFTMHLFGRKDPLHVYGNPELQNIIDLQLKASETNLLYPLIFHPLLPGETSLVFEDSWLQITAFPLLHRVPTHGFLFQEKKFLRKVAREKAASLNVPLSAFADLKNGRDVQLSDGTLVSNAELTLPARKPLAYAYCSDTGFTDTFLPVIQGCDVVYHEATFLSDREAAAREKMHSTARDAAEIARLAGASRLIIGHYSARYDELTPLLEEARAIFPETYLAEDGLEFLLS